MPNQIKPTSTDQPALVTSPTTAALRPFPIVGIGASAGGLEALEQFISHVPVDCGMAFVVIQHLDPTQPGMLPELLQRATVMQVLQAKNRMKVMPDHVYVIPPNRDLSILHDRLCLLEPVAPRGLRLPIDFFFRALADDRREHAVGVILSGMGSDGTLGLRAIKEFGGLVLAQEPANAKFDSMPKSVIDAGLADIVANAEMLPLRISETLHHSRMRTAGRSSTSLNPPRSKALSTRSAFCCARAPATIFPITRKPPFIAALNAAWRSIRWTGSAPTRVICVKTRRKSTCCSRSC
jgi:chemotaxis response regulator CheB